MTPALPLKFRHLADGRFYIWSVSLLNPSLMVSVFWSQQENCLWPRYFVASFSSLCLCAFVSSHCAGSVDGEDACLCPRLGEKTFTVDTIKSEACCGILLFFRLSFSLKSWVHMAPYKPGRVRQTYLSFWCSGSRGKGSATALRLAWSQRGSR